MRDKASVFQKCLTFFHETHFSYQAELDLKFQGKYITVQKCTIYASIQLKKMT